MIRWTCSDRVGLAVVDRPERRNALDAEHCRELAEVLGRDDTRAVVLTGAGSVFSAGADLSRRAADVDAGRDDSFRAAFRGLLTTIVELPVPVIAAVNGPAIGAGLQLALTSDFRVAGPSASFVIPAARLGLALDLSMIERIVARVGMGTARDLLIAGRTLDRDEAVQARVVDRIADDAVAGACAWARELASLAPLTVAAHKRALTAIERAATLRDAERVEIEGVLDAVLASDDMKEGVRAFVEKRAPRFEGS